jgi:2'-5' RNA ligase
LTGEKARLFVALELPDGAREALARWREGAVGGTAEGIRAVRPEDLHVTLCFLGWRDAGEVDAIGRACKVVRGRGAVELALGEVALLPRRRPRVLAVELEDARGGLRDVQAALSTALQAGDFYEPEARPFYGHVTLARAGRGGRIPRSALLAAAPDELRFRGSTVVVYRSHPRRGGARYEALERIELGATKRLSRRRG